MVEKEVLAKGRKGSVSLKKMDRLEKARGGNLMKTLTMVEQC